jgi:hypothetical protein
MMTNGYNLSPKRCPNALLRSHASGQVPRLNKFSGPQRFLERTSPSNSPRAAIPLSR